MSTSSGAALPRAALPTWFSTIATSFIAAGKSQGWETKPRVLVVDDEYAFRELLSLYLGDQGLEVATARSLVEARPVIERGQFDLVVLDWLLEGVEALGLLQLCRERRPDVPVIIFTGTDLEGHRVKDLLAQGAYAVIRKSGPLDVLSAAIRRSLEPTPVEETPAAPATCAAAVA